MKRLLLVALPVVLILAGLPIAAAVIVAMTSTAAAECTTSTQTTAAEIPGGVGEIGNTDGPIGGPVRGRVGVAQANIPLRSGLSGFQASMPKVLSAGPDFVTLNEASGWTLAQIEDAAPGYQAFRHSQSTGDANSMANVVAWKDQEWTRVNAGRVQLVADDRFYFRGRPVVWDRFATWVMLQRRSDGAVVSVIATHHMINPRNHPRQHGNPSLTRPEQYAEGMDHLLQLRDTLAVHGPVLIGGDMNTHATDTALPWAAAAKMKAAGHRWHHHAVDFLFYPHHQGVTLTDARSGTMASDHHWIAATLDMNGAGPDTTTSSGGAVSTAAGGCATPTAAGCAAALSYELGKVTPELVQLVNILGPRFDITTVGGYRPSATDPNGHPAGLAADFMTTTKTQGNRLAAYAQAHAGELGIDYIIWWQQIWSIDRAAEGWRPMDDRGGGTENHRDHVHINIRPGAPVHHPAAGGGGSGGGGCGAVVYPVGAEYVGADRRNWRAAGGSWSSWHTGTDFSTPCGVPVYAAHAGTVEIDTTQSWAGPHLVKISTGPGALATWYAHLAAVTVSRGQHVEAGDPIGLVGDQGNATGCHLHFEVHLKDGPIYGPDNTDPSVWLAESATPPTHTT
ncbi:MAG: peptidoglycan DD-metalloendopeptidase family protein [Nocardioides sp.]